MVRLESRHREVNRLTSEMEGYMAKRRGKEKVRRGRRKGAKMKARPKAKKEPMILYKANVSPYLRKDFARGVKVRNIISKRVGVICDRRPGPWNVLVEIVSPAAGFTLARWYLPNLAIVKD